MGKHGDRRIGADSKDEDGQTPLWHAAEERHEAVVRLLVEQNDIEADSKDKCSLTLLLYVAGGGYEEVVKLLQSSIAS